MYFFFKMFMLKNIVPEILIVTHRKMKIISALCPLPLFELFGPVNKYFYKTFEVYVVYLKLTEYIWKYMNK